MTGDRLRSIMQKVKEGKIEIDKAVDKLKDPGYEDIGFAKIDHDRKKRKGFPEVVLCEGKNSDQVTGIMKKLAARNDNILATRADPEVYRAVKEEVEGVRYNKTGRVMIIENNPLPRVGRILIISAGTADLPVVEEAKETAAIMGNRVETLVDAGVAGIHRLFHNMDLLHRARVIIVVAGMDGALPSVVAGQMDKPVVAIPTSVGYGTNLSGIAPMLTMLNSCAAGVGVVNIDNGFGGAYLANMINRIGEAD